MDNAQFDHLLLLIGQALGLAGVVVTYLINNSKLAIALRKIESLERAIAEHNPKIDPPIRVE